MLFVILNLKIETLLNDMGVTDVHILIIQTMRKDGVMLDEIYVKQCDKN